MNKKLLRTLLIVDNCVKNPKMLIKEAVSLPLYRNPNNPSFRISQNSKYAKALCKQFSELGRVKVKWHEQSGNFRFTTRQEAIDTKNMFFAHSDGFIDFVTLLYLSPPEDCHGGTAFYRHKKTGLEGLHDLVRVKESMKALRMTLDDLLNLISRDARTPSKWIMTDMVQMKHNRAIIYNGRIFHSHVFDFEKVRRDSVRITFTAFGDIIKK